MAPKISEFMIGLVLISAIVAIFGLFIGEMASNYGIDYDNSSIAVYNQLDALAEQSEDLKEATDIEEKAGILDIIGGYFSDAYQALLLTKTSYDTFDTMANQAVDDANLGAAGRYIRIAISTIVLILIFLAIIISAVIKRDL